MRIVLLMLLLTGCATGRWVDPAGNDTKRQRDALECEYEARKATASANPSIASGIERGRLDNMCMELRGYIWRPD